MTRQARAMKIAVDLDDVCLDFVGGLRQVLKKEYAIELLDEQITDFNLAPLLNPIVGQSWWEWLKQRHWLWSTFPAVDGAIGALEGLRRDGHYLVCVTSKPRWAEYATWRWLGKWRLPFQQVIIVSKKDSKADVTDAEVLIDDKVENCREFARAGRQAILFRRPHNVNEELLEEGDINITRANDWSEVSALIWLMSRETVEV